MTQDRKDGVREWKAVQSILSKYLNNGYMWIYLYLRVGECVETWESGRAISAARRKTIKNKIKKVDEKLSP